MSETDSEIIRVLFVCTGNICRSPTAEAVARTVAAKNGLAGRVVFESAGTGDWHVGHPPDPRAIAAAEKRGYDLRDIRARQVSRRDFEDFDLVVAMDRGHHQRLRALCPRDKADKLCLFLEFAPDAQGRLDVPDPYYGAERGFDTTLDLIERGTEGLLETLSSGRVPPLAES